MYAADRYVDVMVLLREYIKYGLVKKGCIFFETEDSTLASASDQCTRLFIKPKS
jgi:hypothetical protein